jgi:hypothetical protein
MDGYSKDKQAAIIEWMDDEWEYLRECEMERRMGC